MTSDRNSTTFTYDAENRIVSTAGYTYVYDGDGKRVIKCAGTYPSCSSGTLYWTGVGSATLSETALDGTPTEDYFYFNGMRVARVDRPSNVEHIYLNDQLGTPRIVATPASYNTVVTPVADSDYSPYGIEIPVSGSDPNHYKFTGKERDSESGLDDFGARYFTSNAGRFVSPDLPFADLNLGNPQSWNLYGYVRNNPLNSIDTNGRVTWLIGGTWYNPSEWTPSSPIGQEMAGFFDPNDDDVITIPWTGGNSDAAREGLAANILSAMKNHQWKPGEQNNIVCHSHGCNGVMAALPTLMLDGYFIDNLVTLGEPMRSDYPYTGGSVDNWWNVYAKNDLIQRLGGRIPFFGGRTNPAARNFSVNTGHGFLGAHGSLHNDWFVRLMWEEWIKDDSGSGGGGHGAPPAAKRHWWPW